MWRKGNHCDSLPGEERWWLPLGDQQVTTVIRCRGSGGVVQEGAEHWPRQRRTLDLNSN